MIRQLSPAAVPAAPASTASGPGPARAPRAQWADTAKGACIVLVVAWHVIVKDYLQIDWHVGAPVPGLWGTLGEQLLPLRMPLFFTISGVFATNALHRPWRVVARSRIARFLYLYAAWLLVHTAVLAAVPGFPTDRATSALGLLEQLTVTPSNLWYLYALALYLAFAKAVRRAPRALVLVPAAALSAAAAAGLLNTPGNRGGLYQNLIFFLAGLHLRPHIGRWAATATRRRLVLTAGAYALALAAMAAAGAQRWLGVWPLVSVVAVAFGITAAAHLCRRSALSAPIATLGRTTLPVYVIHLPVLAVLHRLLVAPLSGLGRAGQRPARARLPDPGDRAGDRREPRHPPRPAGRGRDLAVRPPRPPCGAGAMTALAEAVVDLAAIAHNVRTVAAVADREVMAVVKADGFGHGAAMVARAALGAGASWLGVTSAGEALALRAAGVTAPTLSWLHRPDEDFAALVAADVDVGVSTPTHLHAVVDAARRLGVPATVQLKVDTGLSRNGAAGDDWPELVGWARKYELEGCLRVRGVWSHLADADVPGSPGAARQVAAFEEALRVARSTGLDPDLVHLANSAAALSAPPTRFDLCRIGLALYGVDPFGAAGPGRYGLRAAMTLRTTVVNVKRVPAGTGVSYGPAHVTERPTTLALLPLGYADGLPRAAGGRAAVWLGDRRCPIVGRIAMDQCVVDAGDLPVAVGDPAVVFGPDGGDGAPPTVAEWARWAGTIPNEILTGVGPRVVRAYLHGEAENG
ncbi:alanine racemase [Micromonospora sp. URMC 103]|uniref:alanine racemase n=1 Tax=Micromonospora sp. URMC 103 TaxID=3423406 RepID=UPI003F1AF58A